MLSSIIFTLASEELTEQFEQTLADIKGPDIKGRPLFIGDSDIEGWRTNNGIDTEPGKSASGFLLPGSYNVGVGGATCADVKGWVSDALTKLEPSFVVIVCGENDLADHAVPNQAFADFKTVYELIAETGVRTYTVSTKPEPETKALHSEYEAYDALVLGLARELSLIPQKRSKGEPKRYDPPLVIIDSYNGFKALGNPDSLYHSDELPEALHMGPSGYERWAAWLGTAVNSTDTGCLQWLSCKCAEYGGPIEPPSQYGDAYNHPHEATYACAAADQANTEDALPSPSSPPVTTPTTTTPAPKTADKSIVLTLTASGSVGDYSDTTALRRSIAASAGVAPSSTVITVAAASVIITATITVPASTADSVQTKLSSSLGTAAAASAALGITVESAPTVTTSTTSSATPKALTGVGASNIEGDSDSSSMGPIIGGAGEQNAPMQSPRPPAARTAAVVQPC